MIESAFPQGRIFLAEASGEIHDGEETVGCIGAEHGWQNAKNRQAWSGAGVCCRKNAVRPLSR